MRNIWNNDDEPELHPFTATCLGSGELMCVCYCGKVDPYSGVDLALYVLSGKEGVCAVILMMLWYLKDFSFCTDRP